MGKRVAIIQGHPDPAGNRFCHALANAYATGAREGGHEVRQIDVARLAFPVLRTQEDFEHGTPVDSIREAQQTIAWAEHLVICYPLWLGTLPALLKAFFEQTFRYGFAMQTGQGGKMWKKLLKGKSARIVVTMGMPAFFYRWYFGAHGLKSLERSILSLAGIRPIRESLIGLVGGRGNEYRGRWLAKIQALGRKAR